MKELGNYLKETRISNGVSITEACEDLELSTSQLENIESGNVKAFKDVYELRSLIKMYAKYLGLNPDKIVDEFNNFLFQHTSKISLEDIALSKKNIEKESNDNKSKVSSPYTKEYKDKVNLWPVFYFILIVLIVMGILYIVIFHVNKKPKRINELKNIIREEEVYEFTY